MQGSFKKYHHQHSQCTHYPCSVISLHKNVFALVHAGLKNNLNQTSIKKKKSYQKVAHMRAEHTIEHMVRKIWLSPCSECDFTEYSMFLDQHPCWSWNNISTNHLELRDKLTGNVSFSLSTTVGCFYTLVIHVQLISGINYT